MQKYKKYECKLELVLSCKLFVCEYQVRDYLLLFFFSCNPLTARLSFPCGSSSFVSLGFFENVHPDWECDSVLMAAGARSP